MNRLLLVLLASLVVIPWWTTKTSAQSGPTNAEAACLQNPERPDCRAILELYCARNPDEPVCDDDDDDAAT